MTLFLREKPDNFLMSKMLSHLQQLALACRMCKSADALLDRPGLDKLLASRKNREASPRFDFGGGFPPVPPVKRFGGEEPDFVPRGFDFSNVLAALPFTPVSTISRMQQGQGGRGAATGLMTDFGRGVGGLVGLESREALDRIGMGARTNFGRLATLAASVGVGASAGHAGGKTLGESLFHPHSDLKHKLREFYQQYGR